MEAEPVVDVGQADQAGLNGDAPESEQTPHKSDDLLRQDQRELPERVAYLEKRVLEQEDDIVCLKGALAEVMRRMQQLEATRAQNSLLPSKTFPKSPRRAPSGQERPKSMVSDSFSHRTPASPRATPRGGSASSVGKKWGSVSNSIDDTNGHKTTRQSSQLTQSNVKAPIWNSENKYVKMYLGNRAIPLYAPRDLEDYELNAQQEPPQQKLELEWAYGYRGRDTRSNLYSLPTGEVIYITAAVVVLHNFEEQTQRHYLEHTDDIKCIAIHPDHRQVATGQVAGHDKEAGKPHICIWDSMSLNTLHKIGLDNNDFQRGVCCVAFSFMDQGKMLLAVDESNEHNLSVWDLSPKNPKKMADCKASGDPVTQCEFHPSQKNTIILSGKNNISFWSLEEHGKSARLNKRMGIFEKFDKPAHYVMICFAFADNGDVISGDNSGTLYVWGNGTNKISQAITGAHEGGIFSICVLPDGTFLSGGKDGKIYQWDASYEKMHGEAEIQEQYGSVRMITRGPGNMMYVGTIRNCILQGNMEMNFTQVMVEGHKGELWGLDTHPELPHFLTCGYDKHIYMWDSLSHRPVWFREMNYFAHCCCINPKKPVAVVGMQSSKTLLIDLETHSTLSVYTDGIEQVECVQFSPDGDKLAAGNRDNCIYVYSVSEDGKKLHKIGKCSGHSSFVTHIDWDVNGDIIRSNSGDYEILYWRADKCKQETDKNDVRDLEWATNNCTLSFNTLGIWLDGADGTDVNNCAVSHDKKLVATADDFGKVNLFEYPSIQHLATGHGYKGHSSHVTMAKFLADDSRIITTGGNDCTILQWKLE